MGSLLNMKYPDKFLHGDFLDATNFPFILFMLDRCSFVYHIQDLILRRIYHKSDVMTRCIKYYTIARLFPTFLYSD